MIKKENRSFFKKNKKKKLFLTKINPLKKIPTSKDTAKLVGFLTSDDSRMINGESIKIDGGLNLHGHEELLSNFLNKKFIKNIFNILFISLMIIFIMELALFSIYKIFNQYIKIDKYGT